MTSDDIDTLRRITTFNARLASFYAQMEGMKAENAQRAACGESPAYTCKDFEGLVAEYGVGTNDVYALLYH